MPPVPVSARNRLWAGAVADGSGCWLWQGALTKGYGRIEVEGRHLRVHRLAYELVKGPIPDGLSLDHLCRTRNCINPDHLEAVTTRENILRGEGIAATHARKTHCIHGHKFTAENTHVWRGGRSCRTCKRTQAAVRKGVE